MSALIGLQVRLPDNCKCGSDLATIGGGDGKFAAATLACPQCGSSRGAISEFTLHCVESMAARFGAPAAITIRSSAIAKACAKQDEFLKRKYTPTGKSWFDVITDNFAENAPSPSGTGEEQASPCLLSRFRAGRIRRADGVRRSAGSNWRHRRYVARRSIDRAERRNERRNPVLMAIGRTGSETVRPHFRARTDEHPIAQSHSPWPARHARFLLFLF